MPRHRMIHLKVNTSHFNTERRVMSPSSSRTAVAVAHSNIALAKYWGKADVERNLPAVPSLSMTLDNLATTTRVSFDSALTTDRVKLNGRDATDVERRRIEAALDLVRKEARLNWRASVETENNFPTASGLASSASGFAALILAARAACGLPEEQKSASAMARRCSASAARSIFGGFVLLELGAESAEPLGAAPGFELELLVAVTHEGQKSIGSTAGMDHTRRTSPYYDAWLQAAPRLYDEAKQAIVAGDFERLGPIVEQSALLMHASMLGADPAIVYFSGATLNVLHAVRNARAEGVVGYCTMDAGPHVKVITRPQDASALAALLRGIAGVSRVIHCKVGPDAAVIPGDEG